MQSHYRISILLFSYYDNTESNLEQWEIGLLIGGILFLVLVVWCCTSLCADVDNG